MVRHKLVVCALAVLILCGCSVDQKQPMESLDEERSISTSQATQMPEPAAYSEDIVCQSKRSAPSACSEDAAYEQPEPIQENLDATADTVMRSRIRFEQHREDYLAEDGTPLMYESYDRADFSTDASQTQLWVDAVLEDLSDSYYASSAQMLESAQSHYQDFQDSFYCYSNYLNMTVKRHDGEVMSLLTMNSTYSGGAHPSSIQSAYTFDLSQCRLLQLEDLLEPDREVALHELVLKELETRYYNGTTLMLYEGYQESVAGMMTYGTMTENWYFTSDGLTLYFNQYEIAPYAAGIIKVEIPYASLEGILKPEFLPSSTGQSGSISIYQEPGREEEGVAIQVKGSVKQLQISEETWMDGAPISSRMILSIGNPCDNDIVQIPSVPADGTVYAVEYVTGENESQKYYLVDNVLSDTP